MARTKASLKSNKENKNTSTTAVKKSATWKAPAVKKNTKAIDAPPSTDNVTKPVPAPRGRRGTRQSAAGSALILQPVDTNVGKAGEDQAVADANNISNNQSNPQTPATNTSENCEDLAATNASLKEQLRKTNARLEATNATLMRIKAWEDVKPHSDVLILEPKVKPYCLLTEMRLENDKLLYNACRATARETIKAKFQAYQSDWRKQDAEFIASAQALIEKHQPVLKNYERGWATLEMMWTYMKGKRAYLALLAKLEQEHYAAAEQLFGGINLSAARRPVPVVPDSEEEDGSAAPPAKKAQALKKKKTTVVVVEDDEEEEEEEEEVAEKRKGKGRKRARVVESSSEEDSKSDTESSSDEEQVPIKVKKAKGKMCKAKKAKKVKTSK
ncbi:hypothetical protein BJ165DRAFT_1531203 [Panaeolus papilionaceus]|nr:hypothetical protein BJ165DRAFT_1531203 [Panaeolus papilionaceus]